MSEHTASPVWIAMEVLRNWVNASSSPSAPEIVVRNALGVGRARWSDKWDGRIVSLTIPDDVSTWPIERIREEFIVPQLWKLLPRRERKSYIRNRVLASMRLGATDEFLVIQE